jgi:hypothetical protein
MAGLAAPRIALAAETDTGASGTQRGSRPLPGGAKGIQTVMLLAMHS